MPDLIEALTRRAWEMGPSSGRTPPPWDDLLPEQKREAMDYTLNSIRALREHGPSEEMIEAAADEMFEMALTAADAPSDAELAEGAINAALDSLLQPKGPDHAE